MLSRLALRVAAPRGAPTWITLRPVSTSPVVATGPVVLEESPERDHVNFPRRQRPIDKPPVRLGVFPEEWFTALHSQTGATGPYMFVASFTTYLVSKEIWVMEHEFYTGLGLFIMVAGMVHRLGPDTAKYIYGLVDAREAKLKAIRQDEIDRCQAAITDEEQAQWMATSYESLIKAKKENVSLQLEAAYRERLSEAYNQVKRRLDYQLEKTNVLRRVEQTHMVNWIINSVKSSISAKQEDDALKKCVADLKGLATK